VVQLLELAYSRGIAISPDQLDQLRRDASHIGSRLREYSAASASVIVLGLSREALILDHIDAPSGGGGFACHKPIPVTPPVYLVSLFEERHHNALSIDYIISATTTRGREFVRNTTSSWPVMAEANTRPHPLSPHPSPSSSPLHPNILVVDCQTWALCTLADTSDAIGTHDLSYTYSAAAAPVKYPHGLSQGHSAS
ncbi:hypothetical protein FOZ62_011801, partial [Perkinsus olseni]